MATNNSINSNIPIEKAKGGTQNTTFTSQGVIYYDGTKLNSVTGGATTVMTSQGAAMAPIFVNLPTFFMVVAGDPVSPSPGDTWYNSVSNLFRGCVNSGGSGTWVTKANMLTAIWHGPAGMGTSGADVIQAGGQNAFNQFNTSSRYTGLSDSWASTANLNNLHNVTAGAGAGSASSALVFGGSGFSGFTASTELYNGTTWTNEANLNVARNSLAGAGTSSTAALSFDGINATSGNPRNTTESYNGTVWTTVAGTNTALGAPSGAGTNADALVMGGFNNSGVVVNTSERYNSGSNTWANTAAFTFARAFAGGAGTSGGNSMIFAGSDNSGPNFTTDTSLYDGIANTFTSIANVNQVEFWGGGAGSTADALLFGGSTQSGNLVTTERFNGSSNTNVTFTLT